MTPEQKMLLSELLFDYTLWLESQKAESLDALSVESLPQSQERKEVNTMCGHAKHDEFGNHIDEVEPEPEPEVEDVELEDETEGEEAEGEPLDVTEEIADLVTPKVLVE